MFRVAMLVVALLMSAGACSSTDSQPEARTYYESLDLSSPEAAVETFAEAFISDDFMTVGMTFDWHAQQEINNSFDLLLQPFGRYRVHRAGIDGGTAPD